MSAREDILARIRKNQPAPTALPAVPTFDGAAAVSLLERFKAGVVRMGGKVVDAREGALDALMRSLHPDARIVCSATDEVHGTHPLDPARPPEELDGVDVGVVRAVFGVAETGSVFGVVSEPVSTRPKKSATSWRVCRVPRCSGLTTGAVGNLSWRALRISTRLMESTPRSPSRDMPRLSMSTG